MCRTIVLVTIAAGALLLSQSVVAGRPGTARPEQTTQPRLVVFEIFARRG